MRLSEMSLEDAKKEMAFWKTGSAGGFISSFFATVMRADVGNRFDLKRAFPNLVEAYEDWEHAPNETEWINLQLKGLRP